MQAKLAHAPKEMISLKKEAQVEWVMRANDNRQRTVVSGKVFFVMGRVITLW